ncbi:hypothetical protein HTZ84_20870 [Haloterrigena sp. SYSU A558-1]|uniref:Uncharacterized protein n=1 Tax=Haloterrigena gelatinilytica TaxID=2741724 RepID=A0A8J8GHE8_9EURY|nr:hypothetical protein [Haloterrigena gelatinilytica]NUB89448.1 hypothetical protein [Haloterrigena gelatinilytica]NUC74718.1 hypothetical protein [Haloterrigena gelatinilytica]
MTDPAAVPFPFPRWEGDRATHLTVAPDDGIYVVPSGAHERLHRIVIGDRDVTERFDGLRGTKVELALTGWVQLQSDRLTDRVNVDAPDGFDDAALLERFARMHDAGSIAIARYPSGTVVTSTPSELTLSERGARVPVPVTDDREPADDYQ